MSLYTLKRSLLSFVYPNRCPFCGEVIAARDFWCIGCPRLDFYENDGLDTFCCLYNGKSKPLISKAKENADGYAVSAAAKLLHDALAENGALHRVDLITAIPPRKTSLRRRGYNFPALLAREIAQLSGKAYSAGILTLLREPAAQKELSAYERAENVRGAFGVREKAARGKNLLVIDDISTTGATLGEAKRVLSEHFDNVYIAAFAKTALDD